MTYEKWRETEHGKEVFAHALDIALQMVKKNWSHYSIEIIVNVIRHHHHLKNESNDQFKINNNHKAGLARELMAHDERLKGLFKLRCQYRSERRV